MRDQGWTSEFRFSNTSTHVSQVFMDQETHRTPQESVPSLTDALQKSKAKCNKTKLTSYFTEE